MPRAVHWAWVGWLSLGAVITAAAAPPPGRYPEASTRLLTEADLAGKDAETLSNMRNEVFARHGHRFKTDRLHQLFSRQDWYTPQTDDAGPLLTDLERKNVVLIRQTEKRISDAARARAEAAEKTAWAALPAESQAVFSKFRSALKSEDPARIAAFVAETCYDGLIPVAVRETPFGSEFRSTRISRSQFQSALRAYLPDVVVQQMLRKSPTQRGARLYFYSDGEGDEDAPPGRIYRFHSRGGSYRLAGVWLAAGPGEFD